MGGKGWRLSLLVMVLVLIVALVLHWLEQPDSSSEPHAIQVVDLRAYFPSMQGMTYQFRGDGMEYAAFTRQITFTAPGLVQMEDLSGTNLAQVVESGPDELKIIWSEEEFYDDVSILDPEYRAERGTGWATDLVLLRNPIEQGNTWSDQRFRREIVATNEVVAVPLGVFYDVVVVKSESIDSDDSIHYDYYAKNIGLIKRETHLGPSGENYTVVSSLESLTGPSSQF